MALSPMMKHYLEIKEKYKDCIVFYRLGDFYEMFFDDAIKASATLDLTLTGRDCGLEERAPMCGVPFHAADFYISKLAEQGYKVAVCEQLTEPNGRNLVERDVVKVITAGTLTEDSLIDEKSNNFLACVYADKEENALAWVDITTGEFFVKPIRDEEKTVDELMRISPAEIICNELADKKYGQSGAVKHRVLPKFTLYAEGQFYYEIAKEALKNQLKVKNLTAFSLENERSSVCAAGALVAYLRETQMHSLKNITQIRLEKSGEFMSVDITALRNLEILKTLRDGKKYGSLLWVLDKTKTSMGARALQSWLLNPLQNADEINYRLNGVQELAENNMAREGIMEVLACVRDVSRITGKISNGNLLPKDCILLAESLSVIPNIKFLLSGINSEILRKLRDNLGDFTSLTKLLFSAFQEKQPTNLKDGGFIKDGYNAKLDELRRFAENGRNMILEMEAREKQKTGIKTLKIHYNRVFGYYIEVTNSFKEQVPYHYQRKQTLANCERYVTEELKELEEKLLTASERALKVEQRLYAELKELLAGYIGMLKDAAEKLAILDVLTAFAQVAKKYNYVRPDLVAAGQAMEISGGRHPVVERVSEEHFVPNDCFMDSSENRTLIITGPNMAGKSTYMRQVALIVLMAHIGSFVPARSAKIPLTDKIFTRIGASDSLISDQSTFMVEMNEVAAIIRNATANSLLILDEIGRGTSTFDGLSIAWAVVEYLNKTVKAKTLFATHYHELTELEGMMDGVKNYKVTVKELNNSIVFMRKIMRGGANKSFGIEVAALAGVPQEVTDKAKSVLKRLEKNELTLQSEEMAEEPEEKESLSETERILKDIDLDNVTPMQAFLILQDLKEKVK